MSFELLHTFDGLDNELSGSNPVSNLIMINGDLYGTTRNGGENGYGTIFKISSEGSHSVIYNFGSSGSDGRYPSGGLIANGDNTILYGTTLEGGDNNCGTIYSILLDNNTCNILFSFSVDSNGFNPLASLLLLNNKLYGTNSGGGGGAGTIFSYNLDNSTLELIHTFTGSEGSGPECKLINSGNLLYGTTDAGGDNGTGTIFSIDMTDPENTFNTMYSFSDTSQDGAHPQAELLLYDDNLYGTTVAGGANGFGVVFKINKDTNAFTTMHSFGLNTSSDGAFPKNGLILFGSLLYGITSEGGGAEGFGSPADSSAIYTISPNSPYTYNVVYALNSTSFSDGGGARGTLLRNGNILYGTNEVGGGGSNYGTIFKYTIAVPCYNKGTKILVLGENNVYEYKYVEDIKTGDIIKTYPDGYKNVEAVGNKTMINNSKEKKNCMYIMKKNEGNMLTDDLIVTGGHSIYVDHLTENEKSKQPKSKIVNGKHSIFSRNSDNFTKLNNNNKYTYYHFVLENDDDAENYVVWANGILSESIPRRVFNKLHFNE